MEDKPIKVVGDKYQIDLMQEIVASYCRKCDRDCERHGVTCQVAEIEFIQKGM